jgi:hypothetical protein
MYLKVKYCEVNNNNKIDTLQAALATHVKYLNRLKKSRNTIEI